MTALVFQCTHQTISALNLKSLGNSSSLDNIVTPNSTGESLSNPKFLTPVLMHDSIDARIIAMSDRLIFLIPRLSRENARIAVPRNGNQTVLGAGLNDAMSLSSHPAN
jgi:hypothetical protein